MLEGTIFLGRQLLRQAIWETCNRHRPGGQPNIALIGSRRSGSTLLMQILGRARGLKTINQPFAPAVATAHQMTHLPWPAGGFFLEPESKERDALKDYIKKITSGSIHVQEPWRLWSSDFHFRTSRCVLKTTDAHYLEALFEEMGFLIVRYFRHPVPQAISCRRNGWDDKLAHFRARSGFVDAELSEPQREIFERIRHGGQALERFVLGWCCENLPLFRPVSSGGITVFYEDLVQRPEATISMVAEHCSLTVTRKMEKMAGRPSVSVKTLSATSTCDAIKSGNTMSVISRWTHQLTPPEIDSIQRILDCFPGCPYKSQNATRHISFQNVSG